MSVEIILPKFRFWSTVENCWTSPIYFQINSSGEIEGAHQGYDISDFIIERSMRRFDRTGREIFEGDIVDVEAPDDHVKRYLVRFGVCERVMDTGWKVEIVGFFFNPPFIKGTGFYSIVENWQGGKDLDVTKIIGNIHEHPELLEIR